MYLHQKLKYKYKHISNLVDLTQALNLDIMPNYIGWDTETTGLNIITDKPFLVSFGWSSYGSDYVYTFDYTPEMFKTLTDFALLNNIPMFAHNAKFDFHMVSNGGSPIPEDIVLYDSITVARLTENADERISLSLESLGTRYIDDEAKFAGHIIKDIIHKIDKETRDNLKTLIANEFPNDGFTTITKDGKVKSTGKFTKLMEDYEKTRTHWVNDNNPYFQFLDKHFKRANYKDVYDREPELMRNYAADDIVIMLEYLKKALPVLKEVDKDFRVLKKTDNSRR